MLFNNPGYDICVSPPLELDRVSPVDARITRRCPRTQILNDMREVGGEGKMQISDPVSMIDSRFRNYPRLSRVRYVLAMETTHRLSFL